MHTIYSTVLRDRPLTDYIALATNEVYRAVGAYTDTMKKHPNTQIPAEFPFNIAYQTPLPYFAWASQPGNEEILRRFATGMQGVSRDSEEVITKVYPWKDLGSTRLVDIGGSQGHVALAIGSANPELEITIQDLPEVIENTSKDFPTEKLQPQGGKFLLEAHNAFNPQPREAETYFFRHILHDHPDDVSENIIKNILPKLKPWKEGRPRSEGSRVLVCEMVIQPGSGKTQPPTDRKAVYMNICMNSLFNAQERTYKELDELFKRVDGRFRTRLWGENGPQGTEIVEAWLEDEE